MSSLRKFLQEPSSRILVNNSLQQLSLRSTFSELSSKLSLRTLFEVSLFDNSSRTWCKKLLTNLLKDFRWGLCLRIPFDNYFQEPSQRTIFVFENRLQELSERIELSHTSLFINYLWELVLRTRFKNSHQELFWTLSLRTLLNQSRWELSCTKTSPRALSEIPLSLSLFVNCF